MKRKIKTLEDEKKKLARSLARTNFVERVLVQLAFRSPVSYPLDMKLLTT